MALKTTTQSQNIIAVTFGFKTPLCHILDHNEAIIEGVNAKSQRRLKRTYFFVENVYSRRQEKKEQVELSKPQTDGFHSHSHTCMHWLF